jgi:hypothetical protein
MSRWRLFVAALTTATLAQTAFAQAVTSIASGPGSITPTCATVKAEDMKAIGFTWSGEPVANSLELTPEQSGAPSAIKVSVCIFYAGGHGSRQTFNLTVETFENLNGVAQWLEQQNSKVPADAVLTRFGGITCEAGHYDTAGTDANAASKLIQHYVSCDHLDGSRRIGVGFEMPGTAKDLPAPGKVVDLLKTLTARLNSR